MKYITRHPSTAQEKRQWFAAIEQGAQPRLRRSPTNLPTERDEIRVLVADLRRVRKQTLRRLRKQAAL
jgi:hypothetical protein